MSKMLFTIVAAGLSAVSLSGCGGEATTTATPALALDSLLENEFCQIYYPNSDAGYPACSEVKSQIKSNFSRTLPTLELGDPSLPGMFFIHGWPDSAAQWAGQFAHFCATGRFYCVAATWTNFHPDLPPAPEADLRVTKVIDKLAATMREAFTSPQSTTLVIHDWGCVIGYQLWSRYPDLAKQTVAFDIGWNFTNSDLNLTYQAVNVQGWQSQNSDLTRGSAEYWQAPCPHCAKWQSSWVYDRALSFQGLELATSLPSKPLLWFWGNMTRGVPRESDSFFFDEDWKEGVLAMPRGRVVEAPSDHWMHTRVPRFCNDAIDQWLVEEEEDADEIAT